MTPTPETYEQIKAQRDKSLRHMMFVERWANHHGQKAHMTAQEALSCIQHYPPILAITRSYADGKVPCTPDPYMQRDELLLALGGAVELAREAHAHWDKDRDSKVGKLLLALAGFNSRYDQRADAVHAALTQQNKGVNK